MRVLIIVAVVLLPSLASAQVNLKPESWAVIAANTADIVSTEVVIARADGRVVEANPIMGQTSAQRIAVKAAGTAFQVWLVHKVGKTRPKLAKGIGYTVAAFYGGVTIWNTSR